MLAPLTRTLTGARAGPGALITWLEWRREEGLDAGRPYIVFNWAVHV